jgi:hypothetical protein
VSWNFQISIFSIENWYPQSVLRVCETPGFAEFSPFFGIFQVVYYQHGESVGNLYIGKNISTVYDIYIYGPLKQFQEHGISQKLEVAIWMCGYLRDICVIFQVANC